MKSMWILALLMLLALLAAATVQAKPAPVKAKAVALAPEAKAAAPTGPVQADPQKFVAALYERLNQLTQQAANLPALHKSIGQELAGVVDYGEMAKLTLGQKYAEVTEPQRKEFTELLSKMVINTYVKRFKPGSTVEIAWNGVRTPSAGKAVVSTTLKVKKSSADVQYAMLQKDARWRVYDIVVDDASQVQTYKQSFRKILDKEGWDGLIERMKKAADKAPA